MRLLERNLAEESGWDPGPSPGWLGNLCSVLDLSVLFYTMGRLAPMTPKVTSIVRSQDSGRRENGERFVTYHLPCPHSMLKVAAE
jgi:hypothetical protein